MNHYGGAKVGGGQTNWRKSSTDHGNLIFKGEKSRSSLSDSDVCLESIEKEDRNMLVTSRQSWNFKLLGITESNPFSLHVRNLKPR